MRIKYRVRTLFAGVTLLVGGIATGLLLYTQHQQTLAQYNQDDNSGQWQVTFQNRAGIFSQKDVTIDGQKAHLTLTPGAQGELVTSTITPASSYGWRHIAVTGTWSNNEHAKVQLLTCSATPTPIPQQDTAAIRGGTNATGFYLEGGRLDISSLDSAKYPCIHIKLLLSSDQAAPAPVIKKISASWKPKTVFLIKASAPAKITTSEDISYKIDYSVSYVDDTNVVVYMPIPKAVAGSFTEGYGQHLVPTFKSATQGGQYTSREIVLNGVTVPANSVYWNLGTQTAGVTGSLQAVFGTRDGTQNGVTYETLATIVSPNTTAVMSDSNSAVDGRQPVVTSIESKPLPSLQKTATGITLNGTTHIHGAAPYNNRTTYSVQARNDGSKKETIFNAVVTDDLTDIFAKLQSPVCGAVANPTARISSISDGGVLNEAAKSITWQLGHLEPNNTKHRSFVVDYSGCAKDTEITNTVTLRADNISAITSKTPVVMGVDAKPQAAFAKGERTKVQGSGYISAGSDDSAPSNDDPTDPRGKTHMGGLTTYLLSATNGGTVRLDNTVMMDMIPAGQEFVAATLPSNVKGKIFYYTKDDHGNPTTPPSFDYKNLDQPGAGWSDKTPSQASTVKWVAFYVPCLSPTGVAAGGSCADKPNSVIGEITVKVITPQDICKPYTITNTGLFRTFSSASDITDQSDAAVQPLAAPITFNDTEVSHISPNIASFKGGASINGPSQLRPTESGNYTITYANQGTATAKDATITIPIPTVPIAGSDALLDFVNLSGAPYEKTIDQASGKVSALKIKAGDIPVGASRQFTLTVALPRGPKQNATFKVIASLQSSDPNNCAPINEAVSTTTTAFGSPRLQVIKQRDEALIKAQGDIHYHMTFRSAGDVPTTDTFVVDRVPAKTVFKHAYTGGRDDNDSTFQCVGCRVYFARASAPLPANISPTTPLTPNDIYKHFSPGVQTAPGVWAPPAAIAAKDVLYVAYLTDNTSLATRQTNSGTVGKVGMVVTNDDDGDGAATNGSADGTIITNYSAIVSNETLQAIGNSVHTTVLGDPGLAIKKSTAQTTVAARETISWFIDYHNDSQTKDTDVTIEDTLPYGVTLSGLSHQWNQHTQAQGLPTGEQDIMNSPHVSVVTNPDGTTKLSVKVAQGLRGGDLFFQEGGRLHVKATVKQDTASDTVVTNEARGCYQNELVGPFCVNDSSSVTINNADLWLRKQVNNTQPVAGDQLIYSLVIANKGQHAAHNVVIKDTLPAGLCYEDINIVTPSGWSTGKPHIEGNAADCREKPTTLVWSRDHNNALTQQGSEAGYIPGDSADITLQYTARVHAATAPGSKLTNGAVVTTDTPEDAAYPNGDDKTVATPLPDPYIRKTASQATVLPGNAVDYYLAYGNASREAAAGSVIIDGLPDYDGDGRTDITVLSVVPQNNETIYYYDETTAPKLQTLQLSATYDFAGNADFKRGTNDFATGTYPTHIIIVPKDNGSLPMLDGPHTVLVKVQSTNPYTNADIPAGTTITNHAEISSTTQDGDPTNNTADSSVKTPTADLEITKTATPSGSFPGAAPGEQITYTIRFANRGVAPVCSVFIKEHYPDSITNISQSFTRLQLMNAGGAPMNPVDPTGAQIGAPVSVSYNNATSRWQLGADDYANVCIPSGAEGSFAITATVKDATPDKHAIVNAVEIGEDSPATEDSLANNRASVSTTVYRADVRIKKDGVSAGKDGIFGTADDSATEVKPKEHIRYNLAYNNSGNRDAKETVINETVPENTCFTVGSIKNHPAGTNISYSNDGGSTYTYKPQGSDGDKDCNVTHFRVDFDTLSAPANLAAGSKTVLGPSREVMGNIAEITTGINYAFARKTDGTLWAWGWNGYGQLGNGNTTDQHTPVKVMDNAAEITLGRNQYSTFARKADGTLWAWGWNRYGQLGYSAHHKILDNVAEAVVASDRTFARKTDGTLWAWGRNNEGQLGNGNTYHQHTPVKVMDDVAEVITARSSHTLARKTDGTLWAWGKNEYGQLGNGNTNRRYAPVKVMDDVAEVAAGGLHTLARKTDGTLWAWGWNNYGQLGNGNTTNQHTPVKVMDGVAGVATSYSHTLARKTDGTLWAWGRNTSGLLGNGNTTNQHTPVKVMDNAADIVVADNHTLARKTDGTLWAWGWNNHGQLGDGTFTNRHTPVKVLDNVAEIAAGDSHTLARKTDSTLWAWGRNDDGQLGNGNTTNQHTPVKVMDGVAGVATSYSHTLARKTDGTLWAWGGNYYGQLGNGNTTNQHTPVKVMDGVAGVATSYSHTLARKTDGTLWAWGRNEDGQLGYLNLAQHKIMDNITGVAVGRDHTLARKTDGTLWAWGSNDEGQLGNGSIVTQYTPIRVLDNVAEIAAGDSHTLARKTDGTLWAWGSNRNGQLGNNTFTSQRTPVKVLDNVAEITAGDSHTLARKTDGTLWAWGANYYGQLGNGNTTSQNTPVKVLDNVAEVSAGNNYTLARKTDGTLWAWGRNNSNRLGSGNAVNQLTPMKVLDNVAGVATVGEHHTLARKTDGTLWAWGANYYGQLGNGSTTSQNTPVKVLDNVAEVSAGNNYTLARKTDGTLWAWGSRYHGSIGNARIPSAVSGTGGVVYSPTNGTTTIPLSSPTQPLAWKGLYIDTESLDQPANATIRYDLLQQDCQTPVARFENLDPSRSPIDISSLPAATTHFCLKVAYQNVRQMSVTARMSYEGKEDPSISFDVVTDDTLDTATINNTATITTTTPETNYDNNSSSHTLRVPQADISLTKRVDQSVISPQDITGGKQLTYTLTAENKGPNDADGVIVTDTLPAGMTYVSARQTDGEGGFTIAHDNQKVTFTATSAMPVGQRATFTITATIDADPLPAANTQFYNDACAVVDMSDTTKDNNCDSATVTVGSFANVYLQKTAPDKANIGKDITYTLRYGNNGNVPADGWSINDPLDNRLTFVSAAQTVGDVAVTCTHTQQAVTCTPQNNAPLPVGASGEVTVTARVAKDQTLADTNAVITNRACMATTTTQITVSDDCSTATTTVWPGDLAGFGGRVFLDFNKDIAYSSETDKPLGNIEVIATGIDTTKRIYGPDAQHPRYAEVMAALLPKLIEQGVVPRDTAVDTLHTLPNYVVLTPVKTSRDGMYSFSGLKPGTYYAHQTQPEVYGSTGSTGGYLGIDGGTGLPIHSPQDGRGSKQDTNVNANLVSAITLGEGDFSQGNNFGELPGSIGSHIWLDIDNNGLRDADEAGLSGVEVTLYRDVDGNNAYTDGVDTVAAVTKTDENGAYMFTGLSLNSGGGAAKYVVRVTDIDKATAGYVNTTGQKGANDNSQAAGGYAITLHPHKGVDMAADFGYFRPLDLALIKEIDGNNDNTFSAQEQIQPGVTYKYRVTLDNRSLDTATAIRIEDVLPKGIAVVKTVADNGTVTVANHRVEWSVPTLAPTTRAILTVEAVVREDALADYRAGLEASGVSRNTARIIGLRQADAVQNNNESHADAFMKAGVGDRVWIDRNANGQQDSDEPGLDGTTVTLRDAAGGEVATTTTTTVGGVEGIYHFGNIDPGDYTVHFTVPDGYILTTPRTGDTASDSDADQTTGLTPTIAIAQGDNNLAIDAGLVPLLSLGDTVWHDRNNNSKQDADEPGIPDVTVMLFSDDGDGVLDITKDTQVASTVTNEQGRYRFSHLVAGSYFVAIDTADAAVREYDASEKASADPNDKADVVNDGVKVGQVFTTQKALVLQYGVQPQEGGAYNNTVDFGFHKPAPPQPPAMPPAEPEKSTSPNRPPKTVDLADTGENIWLITLASFGSITVAIALLLLMKRRKGKK